MDKNELMSPVSEAIRKIEKLINECGTCTFFDDETRWCTKNEIETESDNYCDEYES